jgi:hypothetical protein
VPEAHSWLFSLKTSNHQCALNSQDIEFEQALVSASLSLVSFHINFTVQLCFRETGILLKDSSWLPFEVCTTSQRSEHQPPFRKTAALGWNIFSRTYREYIRAKQANIHARLYVNRSDAHHCGVLTTNKREVFFFFFIQLHVRYHMDYGICYVLAIPNALWIGCVQEGGRTLI